MPDITPQGNREPKEFEELLKTRQAQRRDLILLLCSLSDQYMDEIGAFVATLSLNERSKQQAYSGEQPLARRDGRCYPVSTLQSEQVLSRSDQRTIASDIKNLLNALPHDSLLLVRDLIRAIQPPEISPANVLAPGTEDDSAGG